MNSPHRGRLSRLVERFGSRITVGEILAIPDYFRALWGSHVQVSTATHESLGIATLEAMYARNYCLLPDLGAYPEVVGPANKKRSTIRGKSAWPIESWGRSTIRRGVSPWPIGLRSGPAATALTSSGARWRRSFSRCASARDPRRYAGPGKLEEGMGTVHYRSAFVPLPFASTRGHRSLRPRPVRSDHRRGRSRCPAVSA